MISVFVATCNRPAMFKNMLQSLGDTTHGFDVEVIAVIDGNEESKWIAEEYNCIVDYSPEKRGALWAWNRAFQLSRGDILIPAGDDQVFYPDWLTHALDAHRTRVGGYGVIGMNDLAYKPPQVATMWLFDRAYCKEVMGGVFAPPMLHYYCIDLWWNDKAKMLDKFWWEEKSIVEHLHSAHNKRPVDELDLEKQGWMEEDNRIYAEQRALGLPVTWEPLI